MKEQLKPKKPFYKRWWFIVLILLIAIGIITSGKDSDNKSIQADNDVTENTSVPSSETSSPELKSNSTENKDTLAKPVDTEKETSSAKPNGRDNSNAKLTELFSGSFVVGEDIPEGRYIITGNGSGNFVVYDGELPIINEILDNGSSGMNLGVPSVTADLKEGHTINISGIDIVVFEPAETALLTTLTAGTWEVGLDISSGKYDATCLEGESGNFVVYSGSLPVVNEILDKSGIGIGVEKVRVNLKDGQIIHISGLSQVIFE